MATEWVLKLKTVKKCRKTHHIQTKSRERERERESWKTESEHIHHQYIDNGYVWNDTSATLRCVYKNI